MPRMHHPTTGKPVDVADSNHPLIAYYRGLGYRIAEGVKAQLGQIVERPEPTPEPIPEPTPVEPENPEPAPAPEDTAIPTEENPS